MAPQHSILVKIFGLQQHSVLQLIFRHPVEPEKGVGLRPKDIFEVLVSLAGVTNFQTDVETEKQIETQ